MSSSFGEVPGDLAEARRKKKLPPKESTRFLRGRFSIKENKVPYFLAIDKPCFLGDIGILVTHKFYFHDFMPRKYIVLLKMDLLKLGKGRHFGNVMN